MAVVGLGTDIVEIERLEKVIARSGDAFAKRVLTDSEMEKYTETKFPARYLAKHRQHQPPRKSQLQSEGIVSEQVGGRCFSATSR